MTAAALLLVLLVCEPLVVAHTANAASAYLLISNVMASVATPFVLLLAVGAFFIVRLNERIADVPKMLTREQLLTLAERNRSVPSQPSVAAALT